MSLSFCMIVKNEQENLAQCLQSVKGVVDEMVVVDTGSTDRTAEIAKEWGAQVYYFDWCDDFAAARNVALKYVTGNWILVLDADERLVPSIVPQIKQAIAQENCLMINLVRQEIRASQSPYSLVSRLFRNHPQIQFNRPYHALVDDSVSQILKQECRWKIGSLPDVAILHEGYQADTIARRNKQQIAKQAMQRYLAQQPSDPYVASKLGALYVEMGDFSKGLELLTKGLNQLNIYAKYQPGEADDSLLYELHYHLGIAHRKKQNLAEAKHHYEMAIKANILPQLKLGAYNNLGNLLKDTGHLLEAKAAYETTLKTDPNFVQGYYNLGMTLRAMGDYPEAIAAYQKAIQLDPNYPEAYQNLGVALLSAGKVLSGLEAFKTAIAFYQKSDPIEAQRLRQTLQEIGFHL
ncbi:tetratricopeptide repeat protein [Capilliphycus salinus ALCB114379]|uniref:tetratricopeptide repeat protein n=1 Tax=Capilliphycus salinus TaxID=2768948 RepID=UPI0039A459A3